MLVRLDVSNFRSYLEASSFSLSTVSKQKTHLDHLCLDSGLTVTKFLALYGDNASGKSNALRAVSFLKNLVGFNVVSSTHFAFFGHEEEPTSISLTFTLEGSLYLYHVELVEGQNQLWPYRLLDESLSVLGQGKERTKVLYSLKGGLNTKLCAKKEASFLEMLTLVYTQSLSSGAPSLFLYYISAPERAMADSTLQKRLVSIQRYLRDELLVLSSDSINFNYLSEEDLSRLEPYVRRFDPSVTSIRLEMVNEETYQAHVSPPLLQEVKAKLSLLKGQTVALTLYNQKQYFFSLGQGEKLLCHAFSISHRNIARPFTFENESEGTKRFIILMSFFVNHNANKTFLLDELERSLHPYASVLTMEFFSKETAKTKTQFIFSTHNVAFMKDFLRFDEVYFADKDIDGKSMLYPLTDYDIRTATQLEKMYLSGEFRRAKRFEEENI